MIAFGCSGYWSSKWNIMDAVILVISIIEVGLSFPTVTQGKEGAEKSYSSDQADHEFLKFLRFVRVLRLVRILRLFRVSNNNSICIIIIIL